MSTLRSRIDSTSAATLYPDATVGRLISPPGVGQRARAALTPKEKPDMQLRGRKQIAAVGGAVAVALLAACSSSSSSSTSTPAASSSGGSSPTSSSAALSGTLNGSGSTFQAN